MLIMIFLFLSYDMNRRNRTHAENLKIVKKKKKILYLTNSVLFYVPLLKMSYINIFSFKFQFVYKKLKKL